MSSLLGLNAAPRTPTRRPVKRVVERLPGEVDHAAAAALVDRVDLAEERQRLVDAELAGPRHERADVLGQAAAAEAEAGMQEPATDAAVVRQRLGQLLHVGRALPRRPRPWR